MCYSHFGNEVCNGAISIMQRGFNNDCYKVNPIGQWEKNLVMAMGFVDHLGPYLIMKYLGNLFLVSYGMSQGSSVKVTLSCPGFFRISVWF